MPIINRLWSVLWRMAFIVRYIPTLPPKKQSANRVFSGTRREPLIAFRLSIIQTATDIKFIDIKYIKYGISVTCLVKWKQYFIKPNITFLRLFFNRHENQIYKTYENSTLGFFYLLFKFNNYPFFQA